MDTRGGDSTQQETGRGAALKLVYRPIVTDYEEATRARARRTPAGRTQLLIMAVTLLGTWAIVIAVENGSLPAAIATLVLVVGLGGWSMVRGVRNMGRRLFRLVEQYGECRMVVDERGTVMTGERGSSSADWTLFREYVETENIFVLLGGDRHAYHFVVLPKRGAQDPADVDRLRELLDRKLKRR